MIEWEAEASVTLEIAKDKDFTAARELYHGTNTALFLSGLENGQYYLRLRGDRGRTSEPLALSVEHQSLTRALWLVALGALIFLATVVVIFRGARDD